MRSCLLIDEWQHSGSCQRAHQRRVRGGFGYRGIEGKINAIKYARENNIPFFGICLGMQLAIIEYARNVANIPAATSEEFSDSQTWKLICSTRVSILQ